VRDVSSGACARPPSIRSQRPAGGGKLSLSSLAVFALAPHSAVGADGGAPAVLAPAPLSVVLADGGAPAVLALTLASSMRAFLPRLRRPGPLLPPLHLRVLPSPPLPACRFPLAPALSALARLLAMPTPALPPASAPTTAPSVSVSVLPLLRLALALVLHGLALPCGLASLGGPRHRQVLKRHRRQPRGHAPATRRLGHPQADGLTDARCGQASRDAKPWRSVERTRHESRGRHRGALCPACPERAAADDG